MRIVFSAVVLFGPCFSGRYTALCLCPPSPRGQLVRSLFVHGNAIPQGTNPLSNGRTCACSLTPGSSHHRWKKVTKGPPSVRNVRERMKGRQRATPDRAAILFLLRIPSTTYTVVLQLWIARTREGHISHQNWCSPAFDVFQQD